MVSERKRFSSFDRLTAPQQRVKTSKSVEDIHKAAGNEI